MNKIQTGLPRSNEEYRASRETLRDLDATLRIGAGEALSPAEEAADARLNTLREGLLQSYAESGHFPPAEPFYKVRDEIAESELYRFLVSVPKGGLLHVHVFSTAPCDWILEVGLSEPGCHVCWPEDIDAENIRGQLAFFEEGKAPGGYRAAGTLLAEDDDFRSKLRPLLMSCAQDEDIPDLNIWTKFDKVFQRLMRFITYKPIFDQYYPFAFRRGLEDHIEYVELRENFMPLYDLDGNVWAGSQIAELYWDMREKIREDNPGFDLKLIYSGVRSLGQPAVWKALSEAVELRTRFLDRNFIIGFDLVGEEDAGHTTGHFLPAWIQLASLLEEKNSTLPLYFHDGESDWPRNENLYDAYLLGTRRIGHGFNLFRFPGLEERLREEGIALEVCPISNQLLRYVPDLRMHPASGYLARGLPVVLGNDDPGIFGNDGLSFDLWEVVVAWELDLRALKAILRNSLVFSGMSQEERASALARWEASWNAWAEGVASHP